MIDSKTLPQVAPEYDLQELYDVGLHYGHQIRKWSPKMAPWIYMEKDGVHIFDLEKTAAQLQTAYNYAYQLGSSQKSLVLVCTKRQVREVVVNAATAAGCSYIVSRWLGGLLTNWEQVTKSLKSMLKTREQLETGAFKGRTKYEIVQIEKDVNRLERFFGGLESLKTPPDALFVIDPTREHNAVDEAMKVGVPVMALIDSDGSPEKVDVPIPGNDDAAKSIEFVITQVLAGYVAGKAHAKDTQKGTTTATAATPTVGAQPAATAQVKKEVDQAAIAASVAPVAKPVAKSATSKPVVSAAVKSSSPATAVKPAASKPAATTASAKPKAATPKPKAATAKPKTAPKTATKAKTQTKKA